MIDHYPIRWKISKQNEHNHYNRQYRLAAAHWNENVSSNVKFFSLTASQIYTDITWRWQILQRLRLGLHKADVNRIGTKSDRIGFISYSDTLHFSTKVCIYTGWTNKFVRVHSVVSCQKRSFFPLFGVFEHFCWPLFLSSDMTVRSKRF